MAEKKSTKPTFSLYDEDIEAILNANHIYNPNQIDRFTKFSRFGFLDPYNTNTVTKEYVFFTKMDLQLFEKGTTQLQANLRNKPFFENCHRSYIETMCQLQESCDTGHSLYSPFCNLLTNSIVSNLDLPDISIDTLDTAANIDGIKLTYPFVNPSVHNLQEFSLDFEDTKHLDVYMFFRIWYEYMQLKAVGLTYVPHNYIVNKILYDEMSCYKIIVGEDGETIIHWAKYWGVYPLTVPRSAFSDVEGSIKFSVSFKSQWVEDMDPAILSDFNKLVQNKKSRYTKDIPIYDEKRAHINGQWCHVPYIAEVKSETTGKTTYKLKWR